MSVAFLVAMTTMTSSGSAFAKNRDSNGETRMTPTDITFSCQPSRVENSLSFKFTLANHSGVDIYALDAFPAVDPVTKQAVVNMNGAYVAMLDGGIAYVLKGIPPLPRKSATVRIIPLATKVAVGDSLERSFNLPLPLAEQSPYYGDLSLREYEQSDVRKVIVGIQFIRSNKNGFLAFPAEFDDDVYRVQTKSTVQDAETVTCEFPTGSFFILKRKDDFIRMQPPGS